MNFNIFYHCEKDGGVSVVPNKGNPVAYQSVIDATSHVRYWRAHVPEEHRLSNLVGVWIERAEGPSLRKIEGA